MGSSPTSDLIDIGYYMIFRNPMWIMGDFSFWVADIVDDIKSDDCFFHGALLWIFSLLIHIEFLFRIVNRYQNLVQIQESTIIQSFCR